MPEPPFTLMYRRPDKDEYQKLTDVMDEVIIKLNELSDKIDSLTDEELNPGLTD